MTTINDLHIRRRNILEIASAVRSLMGPEQLAVLPIAKVTHMLLCDLCELMTEHLADEHKSVYPALLTNKNQDIQNMACAVPGGTQSITISTGIAGYPEHGEQVEDIISQADKALFIGKGQGKNRCTIAGPTAENDSLPQVSNPTV